MNYLMSDRPSQNLACQLLDAYDTPQYGHKKGKRSSRTGDDAAMPSAFAVAWGKAVANTRKIKSDGRSGMEHEAEFAGDGQLIQVRRDGYFAACGLLRLPPTRESSLKVARSVYTRIVSRGESRRPVKLSCRFPLQTIELGPAMLQGTESRTERKRPPGHGVSCLR